MAKRSVENGRSQAVILPARPFSFEIKAILTSAGFDQFCPLLRWQVLKYVDIPSTRRLAPNKIGANFIDIVAGYKP